MSRVDEFSVLIGLDWAAAKHDVCIQSEDGSRELAGVRHKKAPVYTEAL
ncbi:hypothetical protein [Alteromonas sp. ASW11-130]|nr:hypothetical protein [Alteromonas sp. ASW11-130]MCW8093101.1 IS110 family transposase [Alteromonas sp. ASW11-130]